MSVNKLLALFAVIVMVTCPLAAFMTDADGASSKDAVQSDATHIKLTDLDKKDIVELFQLDKKSNAKYGSDIGNILISALAPGFNAIGLMDLDEDKIEAEGVSIQFDYVRSVNFGTEAKTQIAIEISADHIYLPFASSMKGAYVLATDEINGGYGTNRENGIPDEIYVKAQEAASTVDEDYASFQEAYKNAVSAINDATSASELSSRLSDLVTAIDMIKTNTSYSAAVSADYTQWKENIDAVKLAVDITGDVVGCKNYFLDNFLPSIASWATSDTLRDDMVTAASQSVLTAYNRTVSISAALETIIADGDLGTGIREAYSGMQFDGKPVELSGSFHIKLYFYSDLLTEQVSQDTMDKLIENGLVPSDAKGFVVKQSGLNIGALMSLFSARSSQEAQAEEILADSYGREASRVSIMQLLMMSPITELRAELDSELSIDYKNTQTKFVTNVSLEEKSVIDFTYGDAEDVFGEGTAVTFDADDIVLAATIDSSMEYDGKTYKSNGISIDLSKELTTLFDGIHVDSVWLYDPNGSSDSKINNLFGFVTSSDTELASNFYFSSMPIYYDQFLGIASQKNGLDDEEQVAKDLILSHGGNCSHELSDAQNGVDSIKDAITGNAKKDNSMLILGIVVVLIAVLAVIAFAMIIRYGGARMDD